MTVDDWLVAMHAGHEPDPDARWELRLSPPLFFAVKRADVWKPAEGYYDTAPRFGKGHVVIDYDYPPGGWCLLDAAGARAVTGGVLPEPPAFDDLPLDAQFGVCFGCGGRFQYGHRCR